MGLIHTVGLNERNEIPFVHSIQSYLFLQAFLDPDREIEQDRPQTPPLSVFGFWTADSTHALNKSAALEVFHLSETEAIDPAFGSICRINLEHLFKINVKDGTTESHVVGLGIDMGRCGETSPVLICALEVGVCLVVVVPPTISAASFVDPEVLSIGIDAFDALANFLGTFENQLCCFLADILAAVRAFSTFLEQPSLNATIAVLMTAF